MINKTIQEQRRFYGGRSAFGAPLLRRGQRSPAIVHRRAVRGEVNAEMAIFLRVSVACGVFFDHCPEEYICSKKEWSRLFLI